VSKCKSIKGKRMSTQEERPASKMKKRAITVEYSTQKAMAVMARCLSPEIVNMTLGKKITT
jgi:hypothetical protein